MIEAPGKWGLISSLAVLAACGTDTEAPTATAELAGEAAGREIESRQAVEPSLPAVSLELPEAVAAGEPIDVKWAGPRGPLDLLAFMPADAGRPNYASSTYVRRGNPLPMRAPAEPGAYRLVYLDGSNNQVLGSTPVNVAPAPEPGSLQVTTIARPVPSDLALSLDLTATMLRRAGSKSRVEYLRAALEEFLSPQLLAQTKLGVRAYGAVERARGCGISIELAPGVHEPADVGRMLARMRPQPRSRRAAAAAIEPLLDDLAQAGASPQVIVIVNGEDDCPAAAATTTIAALKAAHPNLRLDVIGLFLNEYALSLQYAEWAVAGDGRFVQVTRANRLAEVLAESLAHAYRVTAADGRRAGDLAAGGRGLLLRPGRYTLQPLADAPGAEQAFEIVSGETLTLAVR